MTELVGNWLHFSARQPKRKRAELVCVYCHSKKIKCDLQSQNTRGHQKCSNCEDPSRDCRLRPSKRGKQRRGGDDDNEVYQDTVEANTPTAQDVALPSELPNVVPANEGMDESMSHVQLQSSPSLDKVRAPMSGHHVTDRQLSDVLHAHGAPPPVSQPSTSPGEGAGRSHAGDVDTGFLQIYGPENQLDAEQQEFVASLGTNSHLSDPRQQELQQSFAETYWEYCYPFCPVLDKDTLTVDMARSPLLANALALAASHIQPPLVPHEGPTTYYDRARVIFYNDEEADGLMALKALSLFYWWAPRPPSTAHRHSSWSVVDLGDYSSRSADEHSQRARSEPSSQGQAGLELAAADLVDGSRERLTALCQSKPCIIDPDDCNIKEPQLSDFPSDPKSQRKGWIFIFWVRLCAIIGRIAKFLSRSSNSASYVFPVHLQQQLIDWVHSLPAELQLPIRSASTESFDRDVHQLHLPYLTTIIILHLKRSAHDLPQALSPAILAASCIVRILRDILSRGNARFLMAITCWYSGTAFIALLQACRIDQFGQEAEEGLDILTAAVAELQKMWASANVIRQGFDRLRKSRPVRDRTDTELSLSTMGLGPPPVLLHGEDQHFTTQPANLGIPDSAAEGDWTLLFPFVTRSTNRITNCLLTDREQGTATRGFPSPDNMVFHENLLNQYQDLLEPFMDYPMDFSTVNFDP
ncbi:hypothetical protein G7046_g7808 [Stylonectria norvegica]|nr:hypothetical protein G7046_g7808 [Stylonectria norvegica]